MKITELKNNLFLCEFEPLFNGEVLNYNIVFLVDDESNVLVIDTGFKRHFKQLSKYFNEQNLTVTNVILTHFHRDHVGGLIDLKDVTIYGSINAPITLAPNFKDKSFDAYLPTVKITDSHRITFGSFDLLLEVNEGHSIDGLLIEIDSEYLIVGDDMIYTKDGLPMIPYCSNRNYELHLKSINKLLNRYENRVILPMHGQPIDDNEFLYQDLLNRNAYLNWKVKNKEKQNNEFEKETSIRFIDYTQLKNK